MQLRRELIDEIVAIARANLCIERVVLHGSRARGTASDRADVDLAVHSQVAKPGEWARVAEVLDGLSTLLQIDLVRCDSVGRGLREAIDDCGIELYVRKDRATA